MDRRSFLAASAAPPLASSLPTPAGAPDRSLDRATRRPPAADAATLALCTRAADLVFRYRITAREAPA